MTTKQKHYRSPYYHWRVRELLHEFWEILKDEPPMVAWMLGNELIYMSRCEHSYEPDVWKSHFKKIVKHERAE